MDAGDLEDLTAELMESLENGENPETLFLRQLPKVESACKFTLGYLDERFNPKRKQVPDDIVYEGVITAVMQSFCGVNVTSDQVRQAVLRFAGLVTGIEG